MAAYENNPDLTATPMVVRFSTRREDFPPHLENLKIAQVTLFFSRATGKSFEVPVTHLRFTEENVGERSMVGRRSSWLSRREPACPDRRTDAEAGVPRGGEAAAGLEQGRALVG